jgi:hypothetical protein
MSVPVSVSAYCTVPGVPVSMHVPVSVIVPVSLHKCYEPDNRKLATATDLLLCLLYFECFRLQGLVLCSHKTGFGKLSNIGNVSSFETLKLDCDDENKRDMYKPKRWHLQYTNNKYLAFELIDPSPITVEGK